MTLDRSKVAWIALSTEMARRLRPKATYGRLVLVNGCRLSLASAQAHNRMLIGKTLFGATLSIPLEQMVALDMRQGRAVYLSDLKPRRYQYTPYLGALWPYTLDTSVAGDELRVAGSTYDKGIGMHSESRLGFDLAGNYRWFEALVGLDDKTGQQGSAVVQVLLDGKAQDLVRGLASGVSGGSTRSREDMLKLRGTTPPSSIRLSVTGARELTLVVGFGVHGDVQDHVDWVDARLIK
jgi:hypothetical protein